VNRARQYDDPSTVARALNHLGERWALLIVHRLLTGPLRFSDLRRRLGSISPNVLTQRLTELEASGVVRRVMMAAPVSGWVYELTPRGQELAPVVDALAKWGESLPDPR
jgi:DNA-binding HxlR family transcriptional regulator